MIVYSVQQVREGFFMVFAEEEKAGIRRQGKRLFVESEISCVHSWVTRTAYEQRDDFAVVFVTQSDYFQVKSSRFCLRLRRGPYHDNG